MNINIELELEALLEPFIRAFSEILTAKLGVPWWFLPFGAFIFLGSFFLCRLFLTPQRGGKDTVLATIDAGLGLLEKVADLYRLSLRG